MRIYASRAESIAEGSVWLKKAGLSPRSVISIRNPQTNRRVYCEALQFDENFEQWYREGRTLPITDRENSIVMNYWYRAKLGGIETNRDYDLEIKSADNCWGKSRMCMMHPQLIVRVTFCLSAIGIIFGVLSFFLAVMTLKSVPSTIHVFQF